jgi:hypothetical protein
MSVGIECKYVSELSLGESLVVSFEGDDENFVISLFQPSPHCALDFPVIAPQYLHVFITIP